MSREGREGGEGDLQPIYILGHISPNLPICKTIMYVRLNLSSDYLIRSSKLLNLGEQTFGHLVIPRDSHFVIVYQIHIPRIEASYRDG